MILTGIYLISRLRKEQSPDYGDVVKHFITMAFCETICWVVLLLVVRGMFK